MLLIVTSGRYSNNCGGLLFAVGIQAENLVVGVKVNAMEMNKKMIYYMIHGKIKSIDERLNYIETEMKKYHLFKN